MSIFSRPSSIFAPPPLLHTLFYHPVVSLFTILHSILLSIRGAPYKPPPASHPIRIVCVSDTHSKIPPSQLPKGDLLIHCGDLTNTGTLSTIQQSLDWLKSLQKKWWGSADGFRYIVLIAGNHDSYFDPRARSLHDKRHEKSRQLDFGKLIYLQHEDVTLEFLGGRKLKVYGAPQIPRCGGKEFAFQYERGQDAWSNTIPDDVDVLVTHNPPKWHLDLWENGGLGDEFELKEVWRVKPTLHAFGHVHSGHGKEYVWWDDSQKLMEGIRQRIFGGKGLPREHETIFSALGEWFDISLWIMGVQMLYCDAKGILWNRFWGGARNGGFMINAALTYQITERLGNSPQVVVL